VHAAQVERARAVPAPETLARAAVRRPNDIGDFDAVIFWHRSSITIRSRSTSRSYRTYRRIMMR